MSEDYVSMLGSVVAQLGLSKKDVAKGSGVSQQTVGRVLNDGGAEATVEAVEAVRLGLQKMRGEEIPPPAVTIGDQDDWLWHQAKERLRESSQFQAVLYEVLEVAGLMTPALREEAAFRRLRELRKP